MVDPSRKKCTRRQDPPRSACRRTGGKSRRTPGIADITIEVVDGHGFVVPDANNRIEIRIEGEGTLAGTDNGNPRDKTQMQSPVRDAFNGLALAVIRSTEHAGTIRVTAISGDLKAATLDIVSRSTGTPAESLERQR